MKKSPAQKPRKVSKSPRFKLEKRTQPLSHEDYLIELKFWANKARILRQEAVARATIDWDKLDKCILNTSTRTLRPAL